MSALAPYSPKDSDYNDLHARIAEALAADPKLEGMFSDDVADYSGPANAVLAVVMPEMKRLTAEVERLRDRVHEVADETQRRFAPYQSRCDKFDVWSKWAREMYERVGGRWGNESEATRLVVQSLLEERDEWKRAAEAETQGRAIEVAEAQRQARVWRNLHTAAAQSRDELAIELRQAVEDWSRNDEQVLADSQQVADENEWLSEACRLTVREATSVRAERDRLHEDAASARQKLMDLVGGDWTIEPSLSDLTDFAARFWGDDRRELAAHKYLRDQCADATALADDLLAMFATGEKGHPGRPCVRTHWVTETEIAQLRERRAALDVTAGGEPGGQ